MHLYVESTEIMKQHCSFLFLANINIFVVEFGWFS